MQNFHPSKFQKWEGRSDFVPNSREDLTQLILKLREFDPIEQLQYGDYGLDEIAHVLLEAIRSNKRIALYADYDVDGTMSCVSWIWFFRAIGFENYLHHIPCRFKEGYGVNLQAIQKLIHEDKAELIITMDTGITANDEAAYCKAQGVQFICTDHHKIQVEKMPDCLVLNPKLHPHQDYQELCGCGVTFVLLRKIGATLGLQGEIWRDLLALTGMATICDVVPLNPVNHRLARLGVQALTQAKRPVLRQLMQAAQVSGEKVDEQDIGFRLGPRINAVGRLNHADVIVKAFVEENPAELIAFMDRCNEERRQIQGSIVDLAMQMAKQEAEAPVLFMGHETWHPGVIGIAASKLVEQYWKPTWLFHRTADGLGKGSARSIPGFDVTEAMSFVSQAFTKFGGHAAAGGFTFPLEREAEIRAGLIEYAETLRQSKPDLWFSALHYDCKLPEHLLSLDLVTALDALKPFGMGFALPRFLIQGRLTQIRYLNDKKTQRPKHSRLLITEQGMDFEVMMFNEVVPAELLHSPVALIVEISRNVFRGRESLSIFAIDLKSLH